MRLNPFINTAAKNEKNCLTDKKIILFCIIKQCLAALAYNITLWALKIVFDLNKYNFRVICGQEPGLLASPQIFLILSLYRIGDSEKKWS